MIMLVFEENSGTRVQTHIWPKMSERDTRGKWVEVTWRTDTFSCAGRIIYGIIYVCRNCLTTFIKVVGIDEKEESLPS